MRANMPKARPTAANGARSRWHLSAGATFTAIALALALALALAGCAPFASGAPAGTPASPSPTVTINKAGAPSASFTTLPIPQVDAGWVAVLQIPDGAALGGPQVIGGAPGSGTATGAVTLGKFTLKSSTVVVMFACASPPSAHTSLTISIDMGAGSGSYSYQQQCAADAEAQHDQALLPPSLKGHTLTVTATISTDGNPPQWNVLVEQPK